MVKWVVSGTNYSCKKVILPQINSQSSEALDHQVPKDLHYFMCLIFESARTVCDIQTHRIQELQLQVTVIQSIFPVIKRM